MAAGISRVGVDRPVTIRAGEGQGLRIGLRHASGDYAHGTNELPVQQALASDLHPGSVLYDVGANVGFFSLIGARAVGPAGHVYAFEPVDGNARRIEANARSNRFENVSVLRVAAGSRSGDDELVLSDHPGGAALRSALTAARSEAARSVPIAVVAIDDLVATGSLRAPDVVKIDVEGAELEVLVGAERTVARHRPVLVVELDAPSSDAVQAKQEQLAELLSMWGYRWMPLTPSYEDIDWHVRHVVARPGREAQT